MYTYIMLLNYKLTNFDKDYMNVLRISFMSTPYMHVLCNLIAKCN